MALSLLHGMYRDKDFSKTMWTSFGQGLRIANHDQVKSSIISPHKSCSCV